jgi:hypothetical protein
MLSTASVAMRPLFGVKLGRFYLRSTFWIAASHMRECGVRLGCERPDLKNFYLSLSDDQNARFNTILPQAASSP